MHCSIKKPPTSVQSKRCSRTLTVEIALEGVLVKDKTWKMHAKWGDISTNSLSFTLVQGRAYAQFFRDPCMPLHESWRSPSFKRRMSPKKLLPKILNCRPFCPIFVHESLSSGRPIPEMWLCVFAMFEFLLQLS